MFYRLIIPVCDGNEGLKLCDASELAVLKSRITRKQIEIDE